MATVATLVVAFASSPVVALPVAASAFDASAYADKAPALTESSMSKLDT